MRVKKTLIAGLLMTGLGASFGADAADLVIHNNTTNPSTSIVNGLSCSADIPGINGVTNPGEKNTIDGGLLWLICSTSPSDCKADVYATSDCNKSGASPIATVHLNLFQGKISIDPPSSDEQKKYNIIANGLDVTLNQISPAVGVG